MEPKSTPHKMQLTVDLRIVTAVLLLIIIGMLVAWRPWEAPQTNGRTIVVSGQASIKGEPDEYLFSPIYSFKAADKAAAIGLATAKGQELVPKLKALGIKDSKIKTSIDGYETYDNMGSTANGYNYTLAVTVTVNDKAAAQKVQDYLIATGPESSVTPQPTFSTLKRHQLETAARDAASKDARAKADQSAANLGFKVASVKSLDDGSGFSGGNPNPVIYNKAGLNAPDIASDTPALNLQPGQNELQYSITVTYFIK